MVEISTIMKGFLYQSSHSSSCDHTTAGILAEITINDVITDEERGVKMVRVDKNSIALMSVNEFELMLLRKPAVLTTAVGVDLRTYAIELVQMVVL
jgi:alcohol dehydrogenase class IV